MRYALLMVIALPAAANAGSVRGNGNKTTVDRPTKGSFERIRTDGPLDLTVTERAETRVSVTIDENLHEYVEIEVADGVLHIRVTEGLRYRGRGAVVVALPKLTVSP